MPLLNLLIFCLLPKSVIYYTCTYTPRVGFRAPRDLQLRGRVGGGWVVGGTLERSPSPHSRKKNNISKNS